MATILREGVNRTSTESIITEEASCFPEVPTHVPLISVVNEPTCAVQPHLETTGSQLPHRTTELQQQLNVPSPTAPPSASPSAPPAPPPTAAAAAAPPSAAAVAAAFLSLECAPPSYNDAVSGHFEGTAVGEKEGNETDAMARSEGSPEKSSTAETETEATRVRSVQRSSFIGTNTNTNDSAAAAATAAITLCDTRTSASHSASHSTSHSATATANGTGTAGCTNRLALSLLRPLEHSASYRDAERDRLPTAVAVDTNTVCHGSGTETGGSPVTGASTRALVARQRAAAASLLTAQRATQARLDRKMGSARAQTAAAATAATALSLQQEQGGGLLGLLESALRGTATGAALFGAARDSAAAATHQGEGGVGEQAEEIVEEEAVEEEAPAAAAALTSLRWVRRLHPHTLVPRVPSGGGRAEYEVLVHLDVDEVDGEGKRGRAPVSVGRVGSLASGGVLAAATSPPVWACGQARCARCARPFALLRRKHHCRNCGAAVCARCSSFRWPKWALPPLFLVKRQHATASSLAGESWQPNGSTPPGWSDERGDKGWGAHDLGGGGGVSLWQRVCGVCHADSLGLTAALLAGDLKETQRVHDTGNVNLRCPLAPTQGEWPVHLAAQSGSVDLLHWLVVDMGLPASKVQTLGGRSVMELAARGLHVDAMAWLARTGAATVEEIAVSVSEPLLAARALHAALQLHTLPPAAEAFVTSVEVAGAPSAPSSSGGAQIANAEGADGEGADGEADDGMPTASFATTAVPRALPLTARPLSSPPPLAPSREVTQSEPTRRSTRGVFR